MHRLPLAEVQQLHRLVRSLSTEELLLGGVLLLVVLLLAYLLRAVIRDRLRKPPPGRLDLSIDVAALETAAPPPGGPQLEFYHLPVRLAVIVLAPAGRRGQLPAWDELHDLLDAIVPGLAEVAAAHRSTLYRWPPQLSTHGFVHAFFRLVPLPGDGGKGTPWSAAAGAFRVDDQLLMAGLVMSAGRPNRFGQLSIEPETKWLDVLRVKARGEG